MLSKEQRVAAMNARTCPKCGAAAGKPCRPSGGGVYDPRYTIHRARWAVDPMTDIVRRHPPKRIA